MATAAITKETSIRSVFVILATAMLLVFAMSTVALTQTNEACSGAFSGSPPGSLAKSASLDGSALTDGATVEPGDEVTFTITWDTADWEGDTLDQLHDCFEVNGAEYPSLEYEEKPVANDGSASHTITVPQLNVGDTLCDRARLSGQPAGDNESTQKSNTLCFVVAAPETVGGGGGGDDDEETNNGGGGGGGDTGGGGVDEVQGGDVDRTEVLGERIERRTDVRGGQLAQTGSLTTALAIAGLMLLAMGWITLRRARVLDARR